DAPRSGCQPWRWRPGPCSDTKQEWSPLSNWSPCHARVCSCCATSCGMRKKKNFFEFFSLQLRLGFFLVFFVFFLLSPRLFITDKGHKKKKKKKKRFGKIKRKKKKKIIIGEEEDQASFFDLKKTFNRLTCQIAVPTSVTVCRRVHHITREFVE